MFGAATVLVAVAGYALRRRRSPGVTSFALALMAGAWWALAALFEELAGSPGAAYLWLRAKYLGIATFPVLWLVFTLRHTQRDRAASRVLAWLWLVPLATLAIVASDPLHGWMWSAVDLGPGGEGVLHGAWFWVHSGYSYLLMVAALYVLVRDLLDLPGRFRSQAALLIAATVLPSIVNLVYLAGGVRGLPLDPTPASFSLSAVLAAWALFRLGLFQLVPTAYRTVFRSLPDAVVVVDGDDCVIAANPAATQSFGVDLARSQGCLAADTIPGWGTLAAVTGERQVEVEGREGETQYLEVRLTPLTSPRGEELGRVLIARNISKLRFLEQRADLDPLTGLPNRRRFADEAVHILGIAAREGWSEAVLYLDLDDFKPINDEYGHEVGDQVLRLAAQRMLECVRQGDVLARFGGDEFVMLLNDASEEVALEVAHRLIAQLREPFLVQGLDLRIGASIGVALYPDDTRLLAQLISFADGAMYLAKREGGGVHVYRDGSAPAEGARPQPPRAD